MSGPATKPQSGTASKTLTLIGLAAFVVGAAVSLWTRDWAGVGVGGLALFLSAALAGAIKP
jgi:hypothetical protein